MGSLRAGPRQQRTAFDPGSGGHEADIARLTSRVMALTGRGEFKAVDAALEAEKASVAPQGSSPAPGRWRLVLWSGMRALLEGRLEACDRLAREATEKGRAEGDVDADAHAGVLLVLLRREQDRPAEAEVILRDVLGRYPSMMAPRVAWASLLGTLGRDSQARRELRRLAADEFAEVRADPGWLAAMCQLAELAVLVDREAEAGVLYRHLKPFAWRFAVEPMAAACHGSVSLYLGILGHGLGRWDDAQAHFEDALAAHAAVGAPVVAAHTQRWYAALLRARDRGDDWDHAIELLARAETIYRRLGVDGRATECQALLARSQDPTPAAPATNVWRRDGETWALRFADRSVALTDSKGLRDLACLVASPGQSFHVADLWVGTGRGVGRAGTNGSGLGRRPGGVTVRFVPPEEPTLDGQTRTECRDRLRELESELADAARQGDAVALSLARAEHEIIAGELGAEGAGDDPMARVRRLVALRIRRDIDRVAQVHPELGQHLRNSVRTGTFCAYEPAARTTWDS